MSPIQEETLKKAIKLDGSNKQVFIDFVDPAYSETINSGFKFRVASIISIPNGAPARITVRDREKNTIVCIIPFLYKKSFQLDELILHAKTLLPASIDLGKYFDEYQLKEGDYKIVIIAEVDDQIIKSREHHFSIRTQRKQSLAKRKRHYCIPAWKALLLREGGSMPCCNLVRNEKMLYSTYATDGYDPWNNDAWQALRQSFVDGNPKYCHSSCEYLTQQPASLDEFIRCDSAVDETLLNITEEEKIRYQSYLNGDVKLPVGPSRFGVMVGTVCNIDCIFCPIPFLNNRRTIFTENMLLLLEKHIGECQRITFTGGEPLVYIKELRKLERFFHRNLTVQIVTNGIAINHLLEFGGLASLALRISLNVANKEDYVYRHSQIKFPKSMTKSLL